MEMCCKMLSFGHDRVTVLMNSKQLLSAKDLHKIKLVNISSSLGEGFMMRCPHLRSCWQLMVAWQEESFFLEVAVAG